MKKCLACSSAFDSPGWACPRCGHEPVQKEGRYFFASELSDGKANFPSDAFDLLVKYEDWNFWFRSRSALILSQLKGYFPKAENFLEVGCGNGFVLSCVAKGFPQLRLYGSEVNEQGLHYAAKRLPQAELFQMDARRIPYESQFDVIGLFDVLEHIQEDEAVLAGLHRALKPNGGLLVTVPQHTFLWTYLDDFSGHVRRYSAGELREKVSRAGFQVETSLSFVSLLLPLMLLSRLTWSNNPEKFDPETEMRIHPAVNFLLGQVLSFERLLIRCGIRFPWGRFSFIGSPKEMKMRIPFNRPYFTGREIEYIHQAHEQGHLSGDGPFTKKCQQWLEKNTGALKALLTHSCTAALEMAAILVDIRPGDEVIMPSYTFVSTANAFVLRGGVPVFVDIRPDTLNIDETQIEAAITPKTRAIAVVHYGGVACEMDAIMAIARKHNLIVIEDAAQAIGSTYRGKPLGSFGHLAALSFHETKNIISGEGGALLINHERFIEPATIIREKGTNRSKFLLGQIDKYTWIGKGSSYLPSDIIAAFLWAQLENFEPIMSERMRLWERYHDGLKQGESQGLFTRPHIPAGCGHNAHLYYLILPSHTSRDRFLSTMKEQGIGAIFHYIPLHNSPGGLLFSRYVGDMRQTNDLSDRLVRLPLWIGLEPQQEEVIDQSLRIAGGLNR